MAANAFARQKTLASPIRCSGVTIHSGRMANMTMRPAAPGHGIVFRRGDVAGAAANIPASWRGVTDAPLCTALRNAAGTTVSTVEHLMAALAAAGIDNAEIEIDGPELPIMDGSAAPFLFLLECAGYIEQPHPRQALAIRRVVAVGDETRQARLEPAPRFSLAIDIAYRGAPVTEQTFAATVDYWSFKSEICRARTYGFLHEAEQLRARGLALGASLDNAIILADGRVLNSEGLRYPNELARHKALDAIGDLALVGMPILGRYVARHAGHWLNHKLLAALFADESAFEIVTLPPAAGDESGLPATAAA